MSSTIPNPYSTNGASAPEDGAAAPASAPAPLAAHRPLGMSDKTNAGRGTAIRYINEWSQQNDYPLFNDLSLEDLEGDHLPVRILNIGHWLARGNFVTRQHTYLAISSKETIFKNIKECFK